MENVTISKDKKFMLMQIDGKTKPYKFDINTGIIYGLRNNAIQKMPRECYRALIYSDSNVGSVIQTLTSSRYDLTSESVVEKLKIADSLDNLGIKLEYYRSAYTELADKQTFKEFVEYAKNRISQNLEYSFENFKVYKRGLELNKAFNMEIDPTEIQTIIYNTRGMENWAKPRHYKCFKVNFIDTKYNITISFEKNCFSLTSKQYDKNYWKITDDNFDESIYRDDSKRGITIYFLSNSWFDDKL